MGASAEPKLGPRVGLAAGTRAHSTGLVSAAAQGPVRDDPVRHDPVRHNPDPAAPLESRKMAVAFTVAAHGSPLHSFIALHCFALLCILLRFATSRTSLLQLVFSLCR